MKKQAKSQPRKIEQPEPITPGITKAMVRQHAYELYRDKLAHSSLTLQDWILAEKDVVTMRDRGELLER
jgi:hypothetical protein